MASIAFDTECVDSETPPLFPPSSPYELTLPPISKEYYFVVGPETIYLFTIFALSLNFPQHNNLLPLSLTLPLDPPCTRLHRYPLLAEYEILYLPYILPPIIQLWSLMCIPYLHHDKKLLNMRSRPSSMKISQNGQDLGGVFNCPSNDDVLIYSFQPHLTNLYRFIIRHSFWIIFFLYYL